MPTIPIKKYIAIIFVIMLTYSCASTQEFIVTDIVIHDNISEKQIQEARKKIIGTEVYLLFSDNDVRLTAIPKDKRAESMLLQKIGDNLYRVENENEILDLELNTIFNYIYSCKITIYNKQHSYSSMIWTASITLKRK